MHAIRLGFVGAVALGIILFACADDLGVTSGLAGAGGDAGPGDASRGDASGFADAASERVEDAGSGDAAPDAAPDGAVSPFVAPQSPFHGIWEGTGTDFSSWSVLYAITPNADGLSFGLATYPSLACGGTFRQLGEDGGVDAGPDGGPRLVLHEDLGGDGTVCLLQTDLILRLQSDGTIAVTYLVPGNPTPVGTGLLRRVSELDGGADGRFGVWQDPGDAGNGIRPLVAAIVRNESTGTARGVYLKATTDKYACSGIWNLGGVDGGAMYVSEAPPDGGPACPFLGDALLRNGDGGTLVYGLPDGGSAGALTLDKR